MPDVDDRAAKARTSCPFLTAKQAAYHLGLAASSMKGLRARGRGPRCRLHGRAWYYHIDDLEAWSLAQVRGEGRD
ncbi:helix-turn-helix transcriptional regulator [Sphingomonas pruni]|uniref:helix-turn-helix transcriptional regulator n=1 Tax=Sphingomonas pruni TaxID=40683 RepID=UPI000837779F|nr:helix-turn-helix domain-containing protein [Sphingomonas pruni]